MKKFIYFITILFFLIPATTMAFVPVEEAEASSSEPSLSPTYASQDQQEFVRSEEVPPEQSPTTLLSKIEAMQKELQQLRGQLEVQTHDLKMLETQQRTFYGDLDERINELNKAKSPNKKSAKSASSTKKKAIDDSLEEDMMAESAKKTKSLKAASVTSPKQSEEEEYAAAFELVKSKEYDQATTAMQKFLDAHPGSVYAANTHYWLGELLLMQGKADQAIQQFDVVIGQYGDSNKVAGAHLKLGYAYFDKGRWDKARSEFNKVRQQSSDSALAKLALAKLNEMNEQGL